MNSFTEYCEFAHRITGLQFSKTMNNSQGSNKRRSSPYWAFLTQFNIVIIQDKKPIAMVPFFGNPVLECYKFLRALFPNSTFMRQ